MKAKTSRGAQVLRGMAYLPGFPVVRELLLLALLLLAAVPAPSQAKTDAELLLDLKTSFTNGETQLSDWQVTTDPCDNKWLGVTCTNGQVTKL